MSQSLNAEMLDTRCPQKTANERTMNSTVSPLHSTRSRGLSFVHRTHNAHAHSSQMFDSHRRRYMLHTNCITLCCYRERIQILSINCRVAINGIYCICSTDTTNATDCSLFRFLPETEIDLSIARNSIKKRR